MKKMNTEQNAWTDLYEQHERSHYQFELLELEPNKKKIIEKQINIHKINTQNKQNANYFHSRFHN